MRSFLLGIAGLALFAMPVSAQTAEEIIAKYLKTVGGMEKIQAVKTLRRTGKFTGGGGFEAAILEENKRPNMVRKEFSLQGLTGINAYDGKTGWKIEPWNGKKDAELGTRGEVLRRAPPDHRLVLLHKAPRGRARGPGPETDRTLN